MWLLHSAFNTARFLSLASNDSWLPKSCVALTLACSLSLLVLCEALYLDAHMEYVTSPFGVLGRVGVRLCGHSHCDLD